MAIKHFHQRKAEIANVERVIRHYRDRRSFRNKIVPVSLCESILDNAKGMQVSVDDYVRMAYKAYGEDLCRALWNSPYPPEFVLGGDACRIRVRRELRAEDRASLSVLEQNEIISALSHAEMWIKKHTGLENKNMLALAIANKTISPWWVALQVMRGELLEYETEVINEVRRLKDLGWQ